MVREDYTRKRKGKYLNFEKRIKIEALSRAGLKSDEIAQQIGYVQEEQFVENRQIFFKDIEMIQHLINNYSKRIFDGNLSNEMLIIDEIA